MRLSGSGPVHLRKATALVPGGLAARVKAATPHEVAEPTATERVYAAVYAAILEHRVVPGMRLREAELAEGFGVSRTVIRQALQRLAQDRLVELQHNRGAQVVVPTREQAAQVFDARRVIECEIARRLGGRLTPAQRTEMHTLVLQESAADARGDRPAAIALSGRLHRALAQWAGNPVFVRVLDELLPITTLLMAQYTSGQRPACVAHRHSDLLDAFDRSGPAAAAEMKRHLNEIERSLLPQGGASVRAEAVPRDLFLAYRESAP
jgi:DNA-binding GntR family transcriptional regulator